MNTIDINSMTADLEQFNQAVEQSAQNFNNIFITELATLSSAFEETAAAVTSSFDTATAELSESAAACTAEIKETFADKALAVSETFYMMAQSVTEKYSGIKIATEELALIASEIFTDIAEKVTQTLQSIQELGSYEFALLSENAIYSFMEMKEYIFAGVQDIKVKIHENSLEMTASMKSAFENISTSFAAAMTSMSAISSAKFGNIATTGKTTAMIINKSFAGALSDIKARIAATQAAIAVSCSNIQSTFSATAESARLVFATSTTEINNNIVSIENTTVETGTTSRNIWGGITSSVGLFSNVVSIAVAVMTNFEKIKRAATFIQGKFNAMIGSSIALKITAAAKAAAAAIATAALKVAKTMGTAAIPIGIGLTAVGASFAAMRFATGGFPETGQMFLAREAGPELVGQIGSRNAVVNNDQIVESVSSGVYMAVREAIKNNSVGGKNAPTEVKLYLDGKQITAAVERHQRERGLDLLGGFSYGY